ncbi:hypothetical protein IL306_000947 [Fusarium sp. DS 682]|nr:hypothetical protein IL306_000947 [Fusarium sp. DS 682]
MLALIRTPAELAFVKTIGPDVTQAEHDILEALTTEDDCLSNFEFSPIHIAVLGLYPTTDDERPSLKELIDLLDDANNAPVTTDWTAWKSQFNGRSSLFGDILEYFRVSAYEGPKGKKIIHNLLDKKDKKFCWTPLLWAASAVRVEEMNILISHGANPLLCSNLDANILHAAVESKLDKGIAGALDLWRQFSDHLDINSTNRWIETPLHVACWTSAACVKPLLEAGADPGLQEENGLVALHCLGLSGLGDSRREIVSLLCSSPRNSHINTQDIDGRPPIFDFLDDPPCVEILISNGARLDLADNDGKTVFHHACEQGRHEVLSTLLQRVQETTVLGVKDRQGDTALIVALENEHISCAIKLLGTNNLGGVMSGQGWAPIHYAARIGNAELLDAVFKDTGFQKGAKTIDGKRADVVAMEAGNWHGLVKELIRMHDKAY